MRDTLPPRRGGGEGKKNFFLTMFHRIENNDFQNWFWIFFSNLNAFCHTRHALTCLTFQVFTVYDFNDPRLSMIVKSGWAYYGIKLYKLPVLNKTR